MRKSSVGVPSRFIRSSLQSINESNEASDLSDKQFIGNGKEQRVQAAKSPEVIKSSSVSKAANGGSIIDDKSGNGSQQEAVAKVDSVEKAKAVDAVSAQMMKISTLSELKRFSWQTSLRKRASEITVDINANTNAKSDVNEDSSTNLKINTKSVSQAPKVQSVIESDLETERLVQLDSKPNNVENRVEETSTKAKARWAESAKRINESEAIKQQRAFRKLVQTRCCDPEAVLHDLGFSGEYEQNTLADRLPLRFLTQPSEAAGVDVLRFIRQHPELAAFASELAAVNPYLHPLRAADDSSSALSQRAESQTSEGTRDDRLADVRIPLPRRKASADETETRASILRRFTNSQNSVSLAQTNPGENSVSLAQRLAHPRASWSDASTPQSAGMDAETGWHSKLPARMRKHSLIAQSFVAHLQASASASGNQQQPSD